MPDRNGWSKRAGSRVHLGLWQIKRILALDVATAHVVADRDAEDRTAVADAMAGHDRVVHFAAETHVDRSISGPQDFIRTDVLGTHTLLEAVRVLGVGRYLQISTDEVYGSVAEGSFTEDSVLDPSSPYSASSSTASTHCLAAASRRPRPLWHKGSPR